MSEHPISALIHTEPFQIKSNKDIHASHKRAEQGAEPHNGTKLLARHSMMCFAACGRNSMRMAMLLVT